jgi:hypothetical protein
VEALRGAGVPTLTLVVVPADTAAPTAEDGDPGLGPHRLTVGRIAEDLARL